MNLFLKRLGGFYKYRFLMQQEGKNMSADQFDAWMRANGMRVARGKPTAPARKARRP